MLASPAISHPTRIPSFQLRQVGVSGLHSQLWGDGPEFADPVCRAERPLLTFDARFVVT